MQRSQTAQMIVEQAVNRFGRIDCLINNAGIFISKPFTDYTIEDYLAITAVNLTGFFHITQGVIRQMLTQGTGGHIVNITTSLVDHAESENALRACLAYQGGTGGCDALTRYRVLVQPWAAVECASPSGSSENPAYDPASYEAPGRSPSAGPSSARLATLWSAVLYLERASFVTGEILHIDGGQAAGQ